MMNIDVKISTKYSQSLKRNIATEKYAPLLVSPYLLGSSASNFSTSYTPLPHHIQIFPSPHTPFSEKKKEKNGRRKHLRRNRNRSE